MEETIQALGGLLLKALPTFIIVLLLHFYLKFVFFKPLEKVLQARYDATDGARKAAEASLAKASTKTAEYEEKLRAARVELYKEQEKVRRDLQDERASAVRVARARADANLAEAKQDLAAELAVLKKNIEAESEILADRIADSVLGRRAA